MQNGLAPNLVQAHILISVPLPHRVRENCGLSVVGNWVGRGLFKVEGRDVNRDLIPYVVQLELANVPVE